MSAKKKTVAPGDGAVEASRRIAACEKAGGASLDLTNLGLVTVPQEVFRLRNLSELDLHDNKIRVLSPAIADLSDLMELNLDSNQLVTLPPEIGQLSHLLTLKVESNELKALPEEVGQLTQLRTLFVDGNQLTGLPRQIRALQELFNLAISRNPMGHVQAEILELRTLTNLWAVSIDLRRLPEEIGELTSLERLNLSNNHLTALPDELWNLSNLKQLKLGFNRLSFLPAGIGRLSPLRELDLTSNELVTLPAEIGKMTALTDLQLGGNRLSYLPSEIGRLSALKFLDLSKNQLKTLPPQVGQLTAAKIIDLQGNQFSALPDSLRQLPALERLYLQRNPGLKLSPTVLGTPDSDVSARSILDFYFARQAETTRPLNEVKLIVVGRGGAGKTSAVRALRGLPFRDSEESTPGIALSEWTMERCKGSPVKAHMWDFAGQVITHALHQFFFSVRSVYLLLLTGRENNEREDAEYWLRLIRAFGTDDLGNGPPVIVGLNKWDVPGCRPTVDRGALQERYPFIRGFVEMDCKSNKGIAKLDAALCRQVDRLKWVREPFPQTWDAVRLALTQGSKKRAHLTYAEFRVLCAKHRVTDEGKQDSLAEILHNLGAALNYRKDPRLREATVLQPEWLTRNVYALMRRAEKQAGVLKRADIGAALVRVKNPDMRDYLVRIMERFEIAYTRGPSAGIWLVPQALPDVQPKGVEEFGLNPDATRLRYVYQALPEGLVARAIVRLHEFIEEANGKKRQWGSGAILTREGARALIRTEAQDRQVMITVTGPTKSRQQLAGLCQSEMREIHQEIRGLNPTEEMQIQGTWVDTSTLEADEQKGNETGVPVRGQGTVMIDPTGPNDAFSQKLARASDVWKPSVFISYSKSDLAYRKRLESELKILKNEGLLAEVWQDRMIDPGDTWNETIQNKLAAADVVILLASVAALSTDYITEHEIPKALELSDAGHTVVVPVILEKCRWDKTALGRLLALPDKGRPLNSWKPQGNGWNAVADGLASVFKKLMETGGKKASVAPRSNS
jgi:internalin A